LSVYFVQNFEQSIQACVDILNFGGRGHTCAIYSKNDDRIKEFGLRVPAFRVLVNTPTPQGSTGITTNVFPSMTLGCGAIAGNVTSDNVSPMHLINIKRIAYHVRDAETAFESPEAKAFFAGQSIAPTTPGVAVGGKAQIADAVTKYLASRGLATPGPDAPPRAVTTSVIRSPAASVVDRFIAQRKTAGANTTPSPAPSPAAVPAPVSNPSPEPPAPEVEVVPFVCEQDIRRAMTQQKKIYINKKTIVTPAARDLNHDGDVLIRTE
jgi:acetaldehyde dehydrogenase (acetylating)